MPDKKSKKKSCTPNSSHNMEFKNKEKKNWSQVFFNVTSVVALIGAFISLISLYENKFSPANTKLLVGDYVWIHYFKDRGNIGFQIPVNVSNSGAKFTIIERFTLAVKKPNSKTKYMLAPLNLQRLDSEGNLVADSIATPCPVPGNSTETKGILFYSSYDTPSEFQILEPGTYELTVSAWVGNSKVPAATDSASIVLTENDIKRLNQYLLKHTQHTARVPTTKWAKWGPHYLSEVEQKVLEQKN